MRILPSFFVVACAFGVGCNEIEQHAECVDVCDRYNECFDSSYDTEACIDRCSDDADQSAAFASQLNVCEACQDDRACSETVFPCADDCAGIVP
jgi:hypothetical protein